MILTPFAFGISPELSAENKRKRDARWLEFEEREAIAKLDPLHWHKYTRRMTSEGFIPEEPKVESITPTYDMLRVSQKQNFRIGKNHMVYAQSQHLRRPFCTHL